MSLIMSNGARQIKKSPSDLPPLSSSQQEAFDSLAGLAKKLSISLLTGPAGSGKTLILRHLHQRLGGHFLEITELLETVGAQHPAGIDESVRRLVDNAFKYSDLIIFDGIDGFEKITSNKNRGYSRPGLFDAVEKAILENANSLGKRAVFSKSDPVSTSVLYDNADHGFETLTSQAVIVPLGDFTVADYRDILGFWLGEENCTGLDIEKIRRFTGKLSGHQLRTACELLHGKRITAPTTDQFGEILSEYILFNNVDIQEVEEVDKGQLKGIDDLLQQLETFVTLPMQKPEIAAQFKTKPKRGALLYGAPGTGKTSIGRYLAHRMKGKFFMIDGSYIGERPMLFYRMVNEVFERAAQTSPAVIFIDDADVIFKSGAVYGFNRYLLTKLDGLIREDTGVCVLMTAMNVRDIPVAILRSGRVEVWLETKLPELETRSEILAYYSATAAESKDFDVESVAECTEGYTQADLRRIVNDAKAVLGFDTFKKRRLKSFTEYLLQAVNEWNTLKHNISRATA